MKPEIEYRPGKRLSAAPVAKAAPAVQKAVEVFRAATFKDTPVPGESVDWEARAIAAERRAAVAEAELEGIRAVRRANVARARAKAKSDSGKSGKKGARV